MKASVWNIRSKGVIKLPPQINTNEVNGSTGLQ